ncbi:MAG: hemolysin family protein, partial [Anaerolineae bacterium]
NIGVMVIPDQLAISKANARRLMDEGLPKARAVQTLLEDPSRFITTLMVIKGATFLTAGGLTTWLALQAGLQWTLGVPLALVLTGVVLLVIQIVARALATRSPQAAGLRLGGLIQAVAALLSPLTGVLRRLGYAVLGSDQDTSRDTLFFSEDGLRFLLNVGDEPGLIEEDEKEMIASIFELGETVVREVMVPRIDVVAVEEQVPLQEALDVIIAAGHSRIPVYRESIDHVQGVLYAKDLLPPFRRGQHDLPINQLMRQAYFVPESKKIDDLLRELQQRKVHMAIVVDEYGGTAGVVTIEDLLEEIVGEIQDEYDAEQPMIIRSGDDEYLFDARIGLDEASKVLGVELPSEESDTLGGFIYSQLGSLAVPGSRVQYDTLIFDVQTVSGRRIQQVKVTRVPPAEEVELAEPQVKKSSLSTLSSLF